ncbi:hypothetical protein G3A43_08375 [Paraburkholderia aspalathi]|nr:hypothetical protein [Paraburkholderia aspalathi]MBK3780272.1 hypothetical protein [Paraburkholderia aspalathi]
MTPSEVTLPSASDTGTAGASEACAPCTSRAQPLPKFVGWLMALFAAQLFLLLVVSGLLQTPKDALVTTFPDVSLPFGLSSASEMVDTNTWLKVKWDRLMLESFRSGKVVASVDIVGSLPVAALDAAAFEQRQTYLDLFAAGKLHKVTEHATLTFERHGLNWRLTGATPEQFSAQARAAAYLSHATQGPVTFVSDAGVYRDDTPYSVYRVDQHHFAASFGWLLAMTMLVGGCLVGVAKNSPAPVLAGMLGAAVLCFGQHFIDASLIPGGPPVSGTQALGIFR